MVVVVIVVVVVVVVVEEVVGLAVETMVLVRLSQLKFEPFLRIDPETVGPFLFLLEQFQS